MRLKFTMMTARISCVVAQELDGCRPADGGYRGRVQEAVTALQSRLVPSFASHVDTAAAGLQCVQDKVLHTGLPLRFLPNFLQFVVLLNSILAYDLDVDSAGDGGERVHRGVPAGV